MAPAASKGVGDVVGMVVAAGGGGGRPKGERRGAAPGPAVEAFPARDKEAEEAAREAAALERVPLLRARWSEAFHSMVMAVREMLSTQS